MGSPNALIQETSLGIHYNVGADTFDYGHVERLTAPGLGIEVDEAAVRAAAEKGHRWRSPCDGTGTAVSRSGDALPR